VITRPHIAEPFLEAGSMFTHGITFGGHPVACAVAMANLEVMESEGVIDNVVALEDYFRAGLETLLDLPIAGAVRGSGFFYAIELMKDADAGVAFTQEEATHLVTDLLKPALKRHGMLARADGRGAPIIQFSPPLIAGTEEIDLMVDTTRRILEETIPALS
jgi:adenosylmethionine-8-amino-7-oxononanoate aminotransferase